LRAHRPPKTIGTVVADVLSWIFFAMMAVGIVGGCGLVAYSQWFGGLDTGAPFSFLAGIRMLDFLSRYPLVLLLFVLAAIGIFGLLLTAPYSSSRRKSDSAGPN
jgi:hypothetical protein